MFKPKKEIDENHQKNLLCQDFYNDIVSNHILNQYIYKEDDNYFDTYHTGYRYTFFLFFTLISFFINWAIVIKSSTLTAIISITLSVFIALYLLFGLYNHDYLKGLFFKTIAFFKIRKFERKYFKKEENAITIFQFLKAIDVFPEIFSNFFTAYTKRNFSYYSLKSLAIFLENHKTKTLEDKINKSYQEQPIDFFNKDSNNTKELFFFEK